MRKERGKAPQGVGRALVKRNQLNARTRRRDGRMATSNYHVSDDKDEIDQANLQSIMERNALDEFLSTAMMEEHDFSAQRGNVIMVGGSTVVTVQKRQAVEQLEYEHIRIPRRPRWTHEMATDELQRQEREAFLDWRRELAAYEESSHDKHATPFEKNIEVWKQLWRVAERSHVIAQIVDARNPLLFYCQDIFTYARELDPRKTCVLVINKADFLTREARIQWGKYFESQNIEFVFWSAKYENEEQQAHAQAVEAKIQRRELKLLQKQKEQQAKREQISNAFSLLNDIDDDDDEEYDEDEDEEVDYDNIDEDEDAEAPEDGEGNDDDDDEENTDDIINYDYETKIVSKDQYDIYGHEKLLEFLKSKADLAYVKHTAAESTRLRARRGLSPDPDAEKICIGLLGFPNVGKSSTINALMGAKKVSVASTPGKTKHFQTLSLGSDLMLCDCPGLVFPTFVHSRATLVVNGVIPIDTIRDYVSPMDAVCQLVSRSQIKQVYGIDIPGWKTLDTSTFLTSFCKVRSFYKQAGTLDEARAAKIILKDFSTGKLVYSQCPPNTTPEARQRFYESYRHHFSGSSPQDQDDGDTTSLSTDAQIFNDDTPIDPGHLGAQDAAGVIEVEVTRSKFATAAQTGLEDEEIETTLPKTHKEQMDALRNQPMTKKQMYRARNNLLKGKDRISSNGITLIESRASRGAGKL